jgi:membrane-associated phospholipid phosphatase
MSARAYPAGVLPRGGSSSSSPRGGVALPLLVALSCAAAMALVWVVSTHVESVRVHDAELLRRFARGGGEGANKAANALLRLFNPVQFTIWASAIALFALARGSRRLALAVALVMVLGPFSADLLKPLLAEPHYGFGRAIRPGSWPSGHTTAATVLALSAVLVTPPRWRAVAAPLAGVLILAVGVALLIRVAHMPSDVLGGLLLGTLWVSLAVAALRASERRWPPRRAVPARA